MRQVGQRRVRRRPALQIALLLFCLAAGTAQSWIGQLHFHPALGASQAAHCVDSACTELQAPGDVSPGWAGEGHSACLLCQISMQGGGVPLVSRAAMPGLAPPLLLHTIFIAPGPTGASSQSHHWSSRGPPQA